MIADRRVTWINAVPAIISILAMDPPASRPAGVRFMRSASAPLPLAALTRFESALGVPVIETYGMTEAASMITVNPLDGPRKPGSAGLPAGAEVRVAVPGGPAGPGEVGRVRVRGNGVITEYASGGPPGAIDAEGWLDTGDLGYLDSDGYLFLVGRAHVDRLRERGPGRVRRVGHRRPQLPEARGEHAGGRGDHLVLLHQHRPRAGSALIRDGRRDVGLCAPATGAASVDSERVRVVRAEEEECTGLA